MPSTDPTDPRRLFDLAAHGEKAECMADAAFDRGFITINDAGGVVVAPCLDTAAGAALGLGTILHPINLTDAHRTYLNWHRTQVFRHGG